MSDFGIALLDTFRAKAPLEAQGFATMSASSRLAGRTVHVRNIGGDTAATTLDALLARPASAPPATPRGAATP